MSKAIVYSRFSPRRNAEQSESIETQVELCKAYAKTKGHDVVGEYEDREKSGDDETRIGLWNAIDALKRGGVLIAYRHDRIARGVYLSECIHRLVVKKQATIEVVSGSTNGYTPEEILARQIMQAVAEFEKKCIAARTKAAMLRHQRNGRRMSNLTPYGWTRDTMNPALMNKDKVEQAIIEKMVVCRQQGLSYREIEQKLTDEGITCRGNRWYHATIANCLRRLGIS